MFTGLVETLGLLRRRVGRPVARALVETRLGPLILGESVSVQGACLTVDQLAPGGFECDISPETLARTTLGSLPLGSRVHLERAMPAGGRLGGHLVLGHVDGVGHVVARERRGEALRLTMRAPAELAGFLASKGSVALDGVSLTLNEVGLPGVDGVTFDVMLVPHTLGRTLLGEAAAGASMNVEVDVLARYVARQLQLAPEPRALGPGGAAARGDGDEARGEKDGSEVDDERILAGLRAGGFL